MKGMRARDRAGTGTEDERCYDVVVVGGGASGLAAAIAAARTSATVCVLERDVEAGLPILATGNGRCNLSNAHLDAARYRHPEGFHTVAGPAPEFQIRSFFEGLGLMMVEEAEGRLYPITRRAESVRDVLLHGCARTGVELRCGVSLTNAHYDAAGELWELELQEPARPLKAKPGRDGKPSVRHERKALASAPMAQRIVRARRIVLACGGGGPLKELATTFSLPFVAEQPVLCPLACTLDLTLPQEPDPHGASFKLSTLDGLRVQGALSLTRHGAPVAHEAGEVLFRGYGVSGIAAFNLSRHALPGDHVELDLFPNLETEELAHLFALREQQIGSLKTRGASWFDGVLAPALGKLVHTAAAPQKCALEAAVSLCKHLPFAIQGTACQEQAQAYQGGIPLEAMRLETLEARAADAPALHACGAALDMDADCGGFNLAWAWLSGLRAGTAAGTAAAPQLEAQVVYD